MLEHLEEEEAVLPTVLRDNFLLEEEARTIQAS
jgi:hypothetical protein